MTEQELFKKLGGFKAIDGFGLPRENVAINPFTGLPIVSNAGQLATSMTRGIPQLATGFVDLAGLPFTMSGVVDDKDVFGSTAYLDSKSLLPPKQTGTGNMLAEMGSSMLSPPTAAKTGLIGLAGMAKNADTGLLGSLFKSSTPARIVNQTNKNSGYTVNMKTGKPVTPEKDQGYMMGIYKNSDPRNTVVDGKMSKKDVENFIEKNNVKLNNDDFYLGAWYDKANNKTYLDVSKKTNTLRKSVKLGERTKQLEGFDLKKGTSYKVGNWDEFIKSPEYADRLKYLNEEGITYLSKSPTSDWWKLKGTELEDVYGTENLPQIAGLLAATSPVSDVPRNVRIATEYLRRMKSGEDILQPNFKFGDNGIPVTYEGIGNQMPMETGRAKNLLAASKGEIDKLNREKVRGMAKALLGDDDAMVFDRHWANLSEKTKDNVFTGIEKGVFPTGASYKKLEEVIRKNAKKANITPREYTANIWTGYRNLAQTKGEVFGVKTAGEGIQGESKAISDIFSEMVTDKAKKLDIPRDEFVEQLKKGTMNLTSLSLLGNVA
jgi:hypothetical protein|tara:strand:- start:195 stop:1835 length:1641 start_codon:yes stop_codon:yes gene_type:complete